ncbi:MAG: alpha-hydroxy-acid oxidizing protein [Candidatus Rokubacteria bacterium]|nr:alpha-hydroxy-acid oxidizing protein [Candidatus Rokubacteria bacterium]
MAQRFVTLPEIRAEARKTLPREVWNFGEGGTETETTLRRNRRALRRLAIRQDILVDVREIDLTTSLLGVPLSWPVAIAPMGGLVLFHPEGDVEMGRGAEAGDTLQFLSGATGFAVEDVARASRGPKMFQLYHMGDRAWVADLLARVEASGYHAVVLTVDVQVYSRRERDIAARWSPREAMADARRALDADVALVWVSNHGGRQLDSTQASIDALPPIADAVAGRAAIVVDGGFARGTDVLKGLAWGADVVAVGRTVLWGLAAGGAPGVANALGLLREELRTSMALAGQTRVRALARDAVFRVD